MTPQEQGTIGQLLGIYGMMTYYKGLLDSFQTLQQGLWEDLKRDGTTDNPAFDLWRKVNGLGQQYAPQALEALTNFRDLAGRISPLLLEQERKDICELEETCKFYMHELRISSQPTDVL